MSAPAKAMVLAAGLGTRMRPLTLSLPKPLIEVAGRTLIDRGLDGLEASGVTQAIVNVHYLPDLLIAHLAGRVMPRITVSDERDVLLDSAGGIVKALPLLGTEPFYLLNADTFWIDGAEPNLERLAAFWDDEAMDILLLLADPAHATGHDSEKLDFCRDEKGRLSRAGLATDAYIYAGVAILHPRIFADAPQGAHSLNLYFDRAIAQGRLFGLVLDGQWVTVGTPDAIEPAEEMVKRLAR